jgi:hypothetical protein
MKILAVIYEFHNKDYETTCGLYHVELDSGDKCYLLRNNESVGTIAHYFSRPANECVSIIRNDVKQQFFNLLKVERKE